MTDEQLGGLIWLGIFVLCWVYAYLKVYLIDDWLYERRKRKWMYPKDKYIVYKNIYVDRRELERAKRREP